MILRTFDDRAHLPFFLSRVRNSPKAASYCNMRNHGKAEHMGSRKRSAWAKQKAAFNASLDTGGLDGLFAHEEERREDMASQREAALREKACESKNRYASRAEAEENLAWCEARGVRGLAIYRCQYCNGWHLTSHPRS